MSKYKLILNKSDNTSSSFEFEIPDEEGNYELWFQKEGFGSILVGDISVGEKENVYNLKLGMSDGSEVDAGTFATPVVEKPITRLTLYSGSDITGAGKAMFLNFICDGEKPVVKLDGQELTEYTTFPFASEKGNDKILSLALPFPFYAGTYTLTFEGGGPIYFGNVKSDGTIPSELDSYVGVISYHSVDSDTLACKLITDVTFGTNYGDTLGSGAFRNIPMTTFHLPERIKRVGKEALSIAYMSNAAIPKTIWLHNKIEYMDIITEPTTLATTCSVYLPYSENDEVLFDANNILGKGNSKATITWNIYTDNSTIKNGALSAVDEYTIVNVYHYDGTAWE